MTNDVERTVSHFKVGAIWLSPMHTYYRVEEINEATGQAVLRMGLTGNYKRIRRMITATKNWTFVAQSITDAVIKSLGRRSNIEKDDQD